MRTLLLATFVLLGLGLGAGAEAADPAFDAKRAFADLEAFVKLGPRIPGSEASQQAHAMIRERLRQAGWAAEDAGESVNLVDGRRITAANIWARKRRVGKPRIFLLAHYDTKAVSPSIDPGANDGGSGTALLLELARQFPEHQAFYERGVTEVLPVFDFRFGPGSPPGEFLHNSNSRLASVSEVSLGRSGRLMVEMVRHMSRP